MQIARTIVVLVLCSALVPVAACGTNSALTSGNGTPTSSTPTGPARKPPVTLSTALCQIVSQNEASQAANGPVTRLLDVQDQDEELGLDRVTCTFADFSDAQRPVARAILIFVISNTDPMGTFTKSKQSAAAEAVAPLQDISGLGDAAFGGRIKGSGGQIFTAVGVLRGNLLFTVTLSRDQTGALDAAKQLAQLILSRV